MKQLKVTIRGIRPTILHNGQTADPTNRYTRAVKQITAKGSKKMTDDDYERRDRLEWEAGLYWSDGVGPVMPSDNIEACIKSGAQKSRKGKDFSAAVLCSEAEVPIEFDYPKDKGVITMDALYRDSRFSIRKGVKVQQSRIMRIRPMIPTGWKLTFTLEYDETILNRQSIEQAIADAGALIGLSDWRPKFGRFIIESIEES